MDPLPFKLKKVNLILGVHVVKAPTNLFAMLRTMALVFIRFITRQPKRKPFISAVVNQLIIPRFVIEAMKANRCSEK
jgi:hypothetical protein